MLIHMIYNIYYICLVVFVCFVHLFIYLHFSVDTNSIHYDDDILADQESPQRLN
jgi:hypothetical protein